MNQTETLEQRFIHYVRNAVDLIVGDSGYPVLSTHLIKSGVATHKQLRQLEEAGHLQAIQIQVPSTIAPGKTVPYKAYYTERLIPEYVRHV